jgi:hypothetical protein
MANEDHVAILQKGPTTWNEWRRENPDTVPDLSEANLSSADLSGANLSSADLSGAHLLLADLSGADLTLSDLSRASLFNADLTGADLSGADLSGAYLRAANLSDANVTAVRFSRSTFQENFRGIRVATCYGSQQFKSFAQDQDFIEEFRARSRGHEFLFWAWWLFADCGRSFWRWALWAIVFAVIFALIYTGMGENHFAAFPTGPGGTKLPFDFLTLLYYSVVTMTTLGFGDITPVTRVASMVVMAEVVVGYIMLGGLISIMATKLARRA